MPPGTCICFGHYADCEQHTCNSAGRSDLLYGLRELRVFDGHGGKRPQCLKYMGSHTDAAEIIIH